MMRRLRSVPVMLRATLGVFVGLCVLHAPLLRLPYFWDEAGYYIPAALDFYRHWLLIPQGTLPTGHTPLLSVYLGIAWHIFGFSPLVTRTALILVAALTVVALATLGRCVVQGEARREIILWSVVLLALSPLFFAQSSLAHLDVLVALFTALAVVALLRGDGVMFAFLSSLAILSKETAVIFLPVAWLFAWHRRRERRAGAWIALAFPALPLLAWALYYHHITGFWTGNAEYLQYNLYSTLNPARVFLTLLRRVQELVLAGFNWVPLLAAGLALWATRTKEGIGNREKEEPRKWTTASSPVLPSPSFPLPTVSSDTRMPQLTGDFTFLAVGLCVAYLLTLSLVGGAILPRYLLPVFPFFYLLVVTFICRLPRALARTTCLIAAACFVGSWFINPPYPFPFENNLAYADFIRLHRQAAQFLENMPGDPVILTAWPASGELTTPTLGYVTRPLRLTIVQGFTADDFDKVRAESFDLLYLYSRKWEPEDNWLVRSTLLSDIQRRYFKYEPQISAQTLVERYHLQLVRSFERRGQWVRIYSKSTSGGR